MKKLISTLLILSFVFIPIKTVSAQDYQLSAGDIVDIQILNKTEFNVKQQISPDGSLSIPLIGRKNVAGMTIQALQTMMEKEIKKLMQNAEVAVILIPKPIYVAEQDETGKTVKVTEAKTIEEAQALTQAKNAIKHGDIITIKSQPPIYVVLHDMAKNTWDVKTAKTIAEAKAYAGKDFAKEINYGDTITVEVGQKQDWLDQNWYKVITATSIVVGIILAVRR